MNYWLNTVSRDHVRLGVAGGFTQANHGSPHNLRRMQRGDWLVFYSPRTQFRNGDPLQSFTAIGTISNATVGGNLTNTTLVNRNTNAAIGVNTTTCSEIGNIGKSDACD